MPKGIERYIMKRSNWSVRKKLLCILLPAVMVMAGFFALTAEGFGWLPKADQGVYEVPKKNGKKPLGHKENPLFILEIVPNKRLGTLGYFIDGCEPVDLDRIERESENLNYDLPWIQSGALSVKQETLYKPDLEEGDEETTWKGELWKWFHVTNDKMDFQGYYYKAEGGRFRQEKDPDTEEISYVLVSDGEVGQYNWVTEENKDNIPTDHESDQVWTVRNCNYYQMLTQNIVNNHVFLKNVMMLTEDKEIEEFQTQLITVTPEELKKDGNLKLLDAADVIFLRNGKDVSKEIQEAWNKYNKLGETTGDDTSFETADLPAKAALRLLERMAGESPAALLMQGDAMAVGTNDARNNNAHKLYLMLRQIGAKTFSDMFLKTGAVELENGNLVYYKDGRNILDWSYTTFVTDGKLPDGTPARHPSVSEEGYQYVEDNSYSFSGDGAFVAQFTHGKYGKDKNFQEAFAYFESIGKPREKLSPADIVHYLLAIRTVPKDYRTELRILELQPNNSNFIYQPKEKDPKQKWAARYMQMINSWFKGTPDDLHVTTMSTWEFIGSLEDLNSAYDMIFIGINPEPGVDINNYNDSRLNGTIYQHIGDLSGDNQGAGKRYSGNDITKKKLEQLKSFMDGGKAVVLANGFYQEAGEGEDMRSRVSKAVDKSSYMYDLADVVQEPDIGVNTEKAQADYRKNYKDKLFYETEVIKNQKKLEKVLGEETCKLELLDYPEEYNYQKEREDGAIRLGTVAYNKEGAKVTYRFRITGEDTRYQVRLYMDTNGDGRYAGSLNTPLVNSELTEEIQGLTVTQGGKAVAFHDLRPETEYTVTKTLSGIRQGIVPWKLEVSKYENTDSRSVAINYTAVKSKDLESRTKIKVLQVLLSKKFPGDKVGNNHFNMETHERFRKYLSRVEEFNVDIECISNAEFERRFQKDSGFLEGYDMLVLGFQDVASFTDNGKIKDAVVAFANNGKSIIFCHDMLIDWNDASKFTGELRALTGQDRYGILSGANQDPKKDHTRIYNEKTNTLENIPIEFEKGKGIYYTDNSNVIFLKDTGQTKDRNWNPLVDQNNNGKRTDRKWLAKNYERKWVTISNQGQITNYPYKIPDTIEVAATHTQYFQLDMEAEDMAVWYCLSDEEDASIANGKDSKGNPLTAQYRDSGKNDGIYSSRRNDVRNSFYIYNKGNLTYTGLGHSKADMSDEELQLFVNTLVSSFRATPVIPKADVTNPNATVDQYGDVYLNVIVEDDQLLNPKDCDLVYQIKADSMIYIANPEYYIQYYGYYLDEAGKKVKIKLSEEYTPISPGASDQGTDLTTIRVKDHEAMPERQEHNPGIRVVLNEKNDEFKATIPIEYVREKNLQSVELVLYTVGRDQNQVMRTLYNTTRVFFNQCSLLNLD